MKDNTTLLPRNRFLFCAGCRKIVLRSWSWTLKVCFLFFLCSLVVVQENWSKKLRSVSLNLHYGWPDIPSVKKRVVTAKIYVKSHIETKKLDFLQMQDSGKHIIMKLNLAFFFGKSLTVGLNISFPSFRTRLI